MPPDFPHDADGDGLRRVVASGADLSRPIEVDFFVSVPDQESGEHVARVASLLGYTTMVVHDDDEIEDDDGEDAWTCWCTKTMILTHESVCVAQAELDDLSGSVGGHSDGWGTFGNSGEAPS
jgi:regulator of RNase E activity RraB